jgi:AcrR family transcriptional regulator
MTPRPYTPRKRKEAVDTGRDRILEAAKELLIGPDDDPFSLEAVAKRAGVSRMTVYNQFESKAGLLEALFDLMGAKGPVKNMPAVFAEKDPRKALDMFIETMGEFWTYSRRGHLKLRAAAILDPELSTAIESRQIRRRHGLAELVRRLSKDIKPIVPRAEVVDVLYVMLSFDNFDALAGPEREPRDVVPIMRKLVHATLGLSKPR